MLRKTVQKQAKNPAVTTGSERLAAAYRCVTDMEHLEAALCHIRDLYGLRHIAYHSARVRDAPDIDPIVRVTYSAEWIKRYVQERYVAIDPVVHHGFRRSLPFDWADVIFPNADLLGFFRDAAAHGVGPSGLSVPLIDKSARRGLFSINSDMTGPEWSAFKAEHLSDLIEIGNHIQRHVALEITGQQPEVVRLAPREIECLYWISQGKDVPDIAIILGLSEHTIRTYLKSGRLKLACATLPQAVFKAAKIGLLEPRPET